MVAKHIPARLPFLPEDVSYRNFAFSATVGSRQVLFFPNHRYLFFPIQSYKRSLTKGGTRISPYKSGQGPGSFLAILKAAELRKYISSSSIRTKESRYFGFVSNLARSFFPSSDCKAPTRKRSFLSRFTTKSMEELQRLHTPSKRMTDFLRLISESEWYLSVRGFLALDPRHQNSPSLNRSMCSLEAHFRFCLCRPNG